MRRKGNGFRTATAITFPFFFHAGPRRYGADNYTSGDGTNVWINSYWSTDLALRLGLLMARYQKRGRGTARTLLRTYFA